MNSIMQILRHWGLSDATATPTAQFSTQTTWDIDSKYILKCYQNTNELSRGTRFAELLTPHEIPVAVFIPTEDGQLRNCKKIIFTNTITFEEEWYNSILHEIQP